MHAELLGSLPAALARLHRRHDAFLHDCLAVVPQIISRVLDGSKPPPSEAEQPVYQGQIQSSPMASSLPAPAPEDMAHCPEGAALISVAEDFIRQLPQALYSWPELEMPKARAAYREFIASAMACTVDVPLPALSPGLRGLSSHCRRAIFSTAGSTPLSAPAAALAGGLMAAAAALSKPYGMEAVVCALKDDVRGASGAWSQAELTAALGSALSLHALYVVLPMGDIPPLQHLVEDLPCALETIFNAASATRVRHTL